MRNHFWVFVTFLLLCLIFSSVARAQTDSCAIRLKNASIDFDQGDYDGSIKLIRTALSECKLDQDEKIQANKILILSFLKIDNLEDADKAASTIMKINPYYEPDKFKDEPAYSALFEKYQPTPVFRIGISAGINRSVIDVINTYSIVHDNQEMNDFSEYNSKTGFQLGAMAEYRAFKNLWVELGGMFRQTQYEHLIDSVEGNTLKYSEEFSYMDIPLSVKYYFLKGKIKPYVQAGATFSFMTNALSTSQLNNLEDLVNRTNYRNDFMTGLSGGAGFTYELKGMQIFAAFSYNYYDKIVNKEGTRYSDQVNIYKYFYIDDDFRMDNFQINAGVSYNLAYKNQKTN